MKTPLILLHAFPLDSRMWRPQIIELGELTELIAPDLLGFGTARDLLGSREEIPIGDAASDVRELLDRRDMKRAVVCGISRGGYIALSFARQFPDRLAGLILLDTRAAPADEAERQNYGQLLEKLPSGGMELVAGAMKNRLFGPTALARRLELVEEVSDWILSQKPDAVAAALRGMIARPDARESLCEIHVPTLCMAGTEDGAFGATSALAHAIPGAKLIPVEEAGHLSNLERPDIVTGAMARFLMDNNLC